jgi:hypothetical protein
MRLVGSRPSSWPFISGDSFRAMAHFVFENGSISKSREILDKKAPIVFVSASEIRDFFKRKVGKVVGCPYVLVTNNGDENIDELCVSLMGSEVLHWFAHNLTAQHPKITCIPIGLENARLHCNGIVMDFVKMRRQMDVITRLPLIMSAFTVGNNAAERSIAQKALRSSTVCREVERMNSRAYRHHLVDFMFVASPPGNGFDCHRTWEALYLGVVPVVKKNRFFDSFADIPILQLDEWADLSSYTESDLAKKYADMKPGFARTRMIWMDYWNDQIEERRGESSS